MEDVKRTIVADELQLNNLFKEVLDGLRSDIEEAQQNVDVYLEAINASDGGKEMFGTLYNDSLKVKGSARDRQLKFLNTFKDRVTKKEAIDIAKEMKNNAASNGAGGYNHADMNKILEDLQKAGNLKNVDIDLGNDDED